ncbi:hypothetical protein K1719_008190 [Acacia pycnantha]|nr:hypothetical protein K1719_008190 [Acacia pycnantha]
MCACMHHETIPNGLPPPANDNATQDIASLCDSTTVVNYRNLVERGLIPLKDKSYFTNGYLEKEIDGIPSFVRTTDPNDLMLNFLIREVERAHRALAICLTTFDELEDLSLWKEKIQCLDWLQHKAPKSMVYLYFGSITVISAEQLYEFAWGLTNSKKLFLWIIRPDLVDGGSGRLLTHGGWFVCRSSYDVHVGLSLQIRKQVVMLAESGEYIENNVKREVEKLMNELMEGDKRKKMR